jgi:hypothetical protein
MAITQDQANQLASAYQSGDTSAVQNLVNSFGVTPTDVSTYFPTFDVASSGITLPTPTPAPLSTPTPTPTYSTAADVLNGLSSGALSQATAIPALQQVASAGLPSAPEPTPEPAPVTPPLATPTPTPYQTAQELFPSNFGSGFQSTFNAIQSGGATLGQQTNVINDETGQTGTTPVIVDKNGNQISASGWKPLGNNLYDVSVGSGADAGILHMTVSVDPTTGVIQPLTNPTQQVTYQAGGSGSVLNNVGSAVKGMIQDLPAAVTAASPVLAMASNVVPGLGTVVAGLNLADSLITGKVNAGTVLSSLQLAGGLGLAPSVPTDTLNTVKNVVSGLNAVNNKDLLSLVSSGLNLTGNMTPEAALGLKIAQTAQAINSNDPTKIINAMANDAKAYQAVQSANSKPTSSVISSIDPNVQSIINNLGNPNTYSGTNLASNETGTMTDAGSTQLGITPSTKYSNLTPSDLQDLIDNKDPNVQYGGLNDEGLPEYTVDNPLTHKRDTYVDGQYVGSISLGTVNSTPISMGTPSAPLSPTQNTGQPANGLPSQQPIPDTPEITVDPTTGNKTEIIPNLTAGTKTTTVTSPNGKVISSETTPIIPTNVPPSTPPSAPSNIAPSNTTTSPTNLGNVSVVGHASNTSPNYLGFPSSGTPSNITPTATGTPIAPSSPTTPVVPSVVTPQTPAVTLPPVTVVGKKEPDVVLPPVTVTGHPETPIAPVTPTPTPSTASVTPTSPTTTSSGGGYTPYSPPANITGLPQDPIVNQLIKTYMTKDKYKSVLSDLLQKSQQSQQSESKMIDPKLAYLLAQRNNSQTSESAQKPDYYTYGEQPTSVEDLLGLPTSKEQTYKEGGFVAPLGYGQGGLPVVDGRHDFRHGAHVAGDGDGTSDDIPAMLADGEFVFPADVVSALGNGSTKAGTDKLYKMMHEIRAKARSAKPTDLAPDALKSPLDYLKGKK